MRHLTKAALLPLVFATYGQVVAQASDQQVSLPAESDLVVGHQAQQGRAILVELVPSGETVQNFKRMVTLQTLPEMGTVPEDKFLREFAERYSDACPNTNITEVDMGSAGASGVRLDCPTHPATGTTETVFARALSLGRDLGLVQITMRYFPMPADGAWARDYLGRVTVE
jgi:hypothetical protein